MVAAIQYGGRITDELDKLLMATYAEKFFHQVGGGGRLAAGGPCTFAPVANWTCALDQQQIRVLLSSLMS